MRASLTKAAMATTLAIAASNAAFAAVTGGFATTAGGEVSGALIRSAATLEQMNAAIKEAQTAGKPLVLTYTGNEDSKIAQIVKDSTVDANGNCPKGHWGDAYRAVEVKEFTQGLTIIGAPGSSANFGIPIIKSSNVVIRNMKIGALGGASNDADMIRIDTSSNVWIDHNELFAVNNECNGSPDGDLTFEAALDIKKDSHNITVSYNYIHDSKKVGLDGSSASDIAGGRELTYHHNVYYNVGGRLPLQRGGWVHAYNNLYNKITGSGINVRTGGSALIEKNWFENSLNPVTCRFDTNNCGKWDLRGNNATSAADNATYNITWDDPGSGGINADSWTTTGTFTKTLPYAYEPVSPLCVKQKLANYAGVGKNGAQLAVNDCDRSSSSSVAPSSSSSSKPPVSSSSRSSSSIVESSSSSSIVRSSSSSASPVSTWVVAVVGEHKFTIPSGTGLAGYGLLKSDGTPDIRITKQVGVGNTISCTATQFGDGSKKVSNPVCFYQTAGQASSSSSAPSSSSSSVSTSSSSRSSSSTSSRSSASSASSTSSTGILMTIPTATGTVINSSTTTVSAGTVFDGGNKRIGVKNSVGNCEDEGQQPVFVLEQGATLQNVIIAGGVNGSDGVHCKGDCTIQNVYWEDVCEDAATNLGANSTVTIKGIIALSASDKVFQHNSKNSLTSVSDSYIKGAGKVWRSCGDCTNNGGPRKVTINNVKLDSISASVVGVNSNYGDVATIRNLQIKGYKSGSPAVCVEYKGVTDHKGESSKIGEKWNTAACNVSTSDVKSY